jgi:hypothetical protein
VSRFDFEHMLDDVMAEADIMKRCRHPNIVSFYGIAFFTKDR